MMKTKMMAGLALILAAATMGGTSAWAAKKKQPPQAELTEPGKQLESKYAAKLEALKAEIAKALPKINDASKAAYEKARKAELAAEEIIKTAQKGLAQVGKAQGLVSHAKGKWIAGAKNGIAKAEAKLKAAKTDEERKAAQKELQNWKKNLKEGEATLKERQAILDKVLKEKPRFEKDLKKGKEALAKAEAGTAAAIQGLGLEATLASDKLDAKLAKYVVLKEATPKRLAAFAQQGKDHQKLIDQLLADGDLLVQMAVADGAADGNYGRAMEIYTAIQKASDKADKGALQRLAVAVALEHAQPRRQRNAVADTKAPKTVDPVKRYLHFEKAFLNDELDPGFKNLSVWDYRMVVDGEEPDDILTWGRKMLRNYRPDHITTDDYRWRYVALVRSDIRYGSQDNKFDEADLHFFQNILKNGGVCGRRAFIGRFILRAFGVPTTARPQRGHAALAHWTPDGWVVCLGAGWGSGWTKTPYNSDLNFLATTQARATGETYKQVKRAQWIGDVMGEPRTYGFHGGEPAFWNGLSLYTQRGIIEAAKAKTLAAVGEDIGEANETKEKVEIAEVAITDKDRKITVDESTGVITIPAAATTKPTKSTGKIIFMPSVLGGKQLHYSRNGGAQEFEYTLDVPVGGEYALTARVVTPSWQQVLLLTVNDAKAPVQIPLPHTVGMWDSTEPVEVTLKKGRNILKFSHRSEGQPKGFSIRDFVLSRTSPPVTQVSGKR